MARERKNRPPDACAVEAARERTRGRLEALREQNRFRARKTSDGLIQPRRRVDGRELLSFSSNDYLGLAGDARVVEACRRGLDEYGVGAGASFLVGGYTRAHRELEEALADRARRDRAVLFASGYMANLGILGALTRRESVVFCDKLNHASILDGVVLARAKLRRYPHLDAQGLSERLDEAAASDALVVTESVFSMDGTIAPLEALAEVCARRCLLLVDEAHSFGVWGAAGGGLCVARELPQSRVPIVMGTLGKACGVAGAFVAGEADWIEAIVQFARSYRYTTAPPPALARATLKSLELIRDEGWRRDKLFANIACFKAAARNAGLPCPNSDAPIQAVVAKSDARALAWSERLRQHGFEVAAIRPPTVPEGAARLRVALSAAHEVDDIERLVEALRSCCQIGADDSE